TSVLIDDPFWSPRLRINRERTIPFQYAQCKDTGRIDALRLRWKPGDQPIPHPFWDSDVAKWIEAASYSLATHPDPALDALVDETIALLASAQQGDGYLNTFFTVVKPGERWTDLRDAHELYCAGHLIEAGAAHVQATGKRALLDVVRRYADYIDTVFGPDPGQKRGYCGHEEIELALVKLYQVTSEERYLRLAQYFVNERGRQPFYFDQEAATRGAPGYFEGHRSRGPLRTARDYNQAHQPVRDQSEVVGHAVRAMYLYSAMADLAGETGDVTLRDACRRLWDHLCAKRLYLTGGIGSAAENEGFTSDYDLPNETAYAETCAAIGLVFWAHRMAQLEADGCYADVLEQALYNGVLSGVSLDGASFFYENPLASRGGVTRKPWFGVACCPPNLARLLASLGQYIYSANQSEVAVHLYTRSSAQLSLQGESVTIRQETEYPWDGAIRLIVSTPRPVQFTLHPRRPGWCRKATARINGVALDLEGQVERGYIRIARTWSDGDTVELNLEMPVERIHAHPAVSADVGGVALQRGPLVYCLEEVDHAAPLHRLALAPETPLAAHREAALLGGIVVIRGEGCVLDDRGWDGALYRRERPAAIPSPLTAIPYHGWDNRRSGQMRVWIREAGPYREG
ncbi:MAG TPA: beta-L-arabinofuranosidase domain-containing protein, partial [Chloroflexota bacterium]|nr:beta-L-arabinofuranosidase domain-containing protein [Chloroflexota bacterium]